MRRRIHGYLDASFSRGADYIIWNAERFARCTQSRNPRTMKHVQKVWPQFRKLSLAYNFQLIRLGRSFRWKIRPCQNERCSIESAAVHVRPRFLAYVAAAARRNPGVTVNPTFCRRFSLTTGIPRAAVLPLVDGLRTIPGFELRRRRRHGLLTVRVSPPHFDERMLPSGDKMIVRREPGSPCFAVSPRWISGKRIASLASWLALHPLRDVHYDNCKAAWSYPHARNFALKSLQLGHEKDRIIAAYAAGVLQQHCDAVDHLETAPKAPAPAVAYARRWLKDGRSPGQRWDHVCAGKGGVNSTKKRKDL